MEAESTWWRHAKGTTGAPGLMVAITKDGHIAGSASGFGTAGSPKHDDGPGTPRTRPPASV
ncbi:hypothetical protein ACIPLC_21380 [Kitasatospora sp. NPDC086801]|uniref:hypothetical protein n=1 Tax=Kitasatospora sp. NPDC086801 TaxID=3364066 RepID=UPI003822BEA9